jgi:asparagine synthase (glutamine-hydrolysing)
LGFKEFAGTIDDEVPLAEEVARTLGAWHSTLLTSRQDFEFERGKLFDAMDQPSIDGVNTWFVARAARQMEMKVALSGLGGDELFASYPSFRQVPGLVRHGRPLTRIPGFGSAMRRMAAPVLSRITSPKYAGLLEYGRTLGSAYLLRRCLYAPWELPSVLDPELARTGWEDLQSIERLNDTVRDIPNDRLAVSALEMHWYMRNQLLRDADWAGMAQSLEIRVPFLDLDLLREAAPWFAAYPDIAKAELAAIAAPQLPRTLLARPKTGFSVPVREWIKPVDGSKHERGLRGWAQFIHRQFAGAPP